MAHLDANFQETVKRPPGSGGFPKTRGTFFWVPIIRIIIFGGLDWGPLF